MAPGHSSLVCTSCMFLPYRVCLMLSLMVAGLALAADPPPPPIVGGSTTNEFWSVGMLMADWGVGQDSMFCSGTLINSTWVLTAAHCIEALEEYRQKGARDLFFWVGTSVNDDPVTSVSIKRWVKHPDYDTNSLNTDLGLIELESPVNGVGVMALNADVASSGWTGREVTYVGFGSTGDSQLGAGIKREVSLRIDSVTPFHIYTYQPGTNICQGDSGGAQLMWVGNGWELVGVNSFVYGEGASFCNEGGGAGARVDTELDWIRGYTTFYTTPQDDPEPEPEDQPQPEDTGIITEWDGGYPQRPNGNVRPTQPSLGGCSHGPLFLWVWPGLATLFWRQRQDRL